MRVARRGLIGGLILLLMACGTAADANLILIGHRGASADAPENTLAAFNRAKTRADFVEFDVRSTSDGHLVVMHDATVERTTNGKGAVADFTFAQLRDRAGRLLDLGTKGSGLTPYSRTADGRLTLKGAVREILATEMLEALGANTSKTFSVIETGEELWRGDEPSPTRSAARCISRAAGTSRPGAPSGGGGPG